MLNNNMVRSVCLCVCTVHMRGQLIFVVTHPRHYKTFLISTVVRYIIFIFKLKLK